MATQPSLPAPLPPAATVRGQPTPSSADLDSRELMRGAREVLIHHAGQVYRLRHTRSDKLILVK